MAKKLMNKNLVVILFTLVFLAFIVTTQELTRAQGVGITTDVCPGAGCLTLTTEGQKIAAIQITGTFSGTITFKSSVDGSNYVDSDVAPIGAQETFVTSTTGTGIWLVNVAGLKNFRIVFTTFSSGTAVVTTRMMNR